MWNVLTDRCGGCVKHGEMAGMAEPQVTRITHITRLRCLPSMNCWHLANTLWSLSVVQHFDEALISRAFARVSELSGGPEGGWWPSAKEGKQLNANF